MATEIHIRESSSTPSVRVKPIPKKSSIQVPFFYAPSDDGTDENILILLHGLGDTNVPFTKLGRQLHLPQTAILALRAPEQVPFLYEESYQWYPSFDDLGEIIERPNPTPALELLIKVVKYLIDECTWPPHRIHFFGFGQGGTVAAEFGIIWWKEQLQSPRRTQDTAQSEKDQDSTKPSLSLGSIVSISGPLLSYPTLSSLSSTPILIVHDLPPAESALPSGSIAAFKKAYKYVAEIINSRRPGMPSSKEGWQPIMEFWSKHLGRKQVEGLYEVMSGITPVA